MFDYRNSLQIIIDINLIIIISISIISSYLYLIIKELRVRLVNYIYLTDFVIYSILIYINYTKENIDVYILSIYTIVKLIYYILFKNKLNISEKNMKIVSIITLVQMLTLYISKKYFFIFNIIINIFIVKHIIFKYFNKSYTNFNKNIKKINLNNTTIQKIENKVSKEKLVQQENKIKITELNSRIIKSIKEVEIGIFILNSDNQIKDYNKAFKEEVKCNSDIKSLDIFNYIKQRFINSIECIEIINKITQNQSESIDLYTLDEKVYKFTCIKDEDNNEKVCILNDITQTTIIQKKLIESEEKYRKLMDILSDGVVIHDINDIDYINNSAIKLFGLTQTDDINISIIKNQIDKNSIDKFIENIKAISENKSKEIISKIKTVDGVCLEIITTKIVINNKDKFLTIFVDITNMENALKELEESTKSYKMLIQNLPEGIVIIDKKTKKYIYQNRAMIKILKLSGIENMSKIINDYIKKQSYGNIQKYNFKNGDISSVLLTIIDFHR